MRIEVDPGPNCVVRTAVLAVARSHSLTAYDAGHLELAIRTDRDLATFDRRLAEAARAAGLRVFDGPV